MQRNGESKFKRFLKGPNGRFGESLSGSIYNKIGLSVAMLLIAWFGKEYLLEIKCAWPICFWACEVASECVLKQNFFVIIFSGTLYICMLAIGEEKVKREKESIKDSISRIHSPRVMAQFADDNKKIMEGIWAMDNPDFQDQDIFEKFRVKAIRLCLKAIINRVRSMDTSLENRRCGANVMQYIPMDMILNNKERQARILEKVKHYIDMPSLDNLAGVLEINKALSTSTDNLNEEDPKLEELILPIPKHEKSLNNPNKLRALPGACTAFVVEKGYAWIDDTNKLLENFVSGDEKLSLYDGVPKTIFEQIHSYFTEGEKGGKVGSFISLRLEVNGKKLGVVNIHSDQKYILSSDEKALEFINFISVEKSHIITLLLKQNSAPDPAQ